MIEILHKIRTNTKSLLILLYTLQRLWLRQKTVCCQQSLPMNKSEKMEDGWGGEIEWERERRTKAVGQWPLTSPTTGVGAWPCAGAAGVGWHARKAVSYDRRWPEPHIHAVGVVWYRSCGRVKWLRQRETDGRKRAGGRRAFNLNQPESLTKWPAAKIRGSSIIKTKTNKKSGHSELPHSGNVSKNIPKLLTSPPSLCLFCKTSSLTSWLSYYVLSNMGHACRLVCLQTKRSECYCVSNCGRFFCMVGSKYFTFGSNYHNLTYNLKLQVVKLLQPLRTARYVAFFQVITSDAQHFGLQGA